MVPSNFIHDGANLGVNARHQSQRPARKSLRDEELVGGQRAVALLTSHLPSGDEGYQCPWCKRKLFKFGAGGAGNTARVEVRAPLLEEVPSPLPPCVQGSELRSLGFGNKQKAPLSNDPSYQSPQCSRIPKHQLFSGTMQAT